MFALGNGLRRVLWDISRTVARMFESIQNTNKRRRVVLIWNIPVFVIPLTSLIEIHERKADVEFQGTSCHNPIDSRIIKSAPSYSSIYSAPSPESCVLKLSSGSCVLRPETTCLKHEDTPFLIRGRS